MFKVHRNTWRKLYLLSTEKYCLMISYLLLFCYFFNDCWLKIQLYKKIKYIIYQYLEEISHYVRFSFVISKTEKKKKLLIYKMSEFEWLNIKKIVLNTK